MLGNGDVSSHHALPNMDPSASSSRVGGGHCNNSVPFDSFPLRQRPQQQQQQQQHHRVHYQSPPAQLPPSPPPPPLIYAHYHRPFTDPGGNGDPRHQLQQPLQHPSPHFSPQEMEIPFVTTPLDREDTTLLQPPPQHNCQLPQDPNSNGNGSQHLAAVAANNHNHHHPHRHLHHKERVSKGTTTSSSPPHLHSPPALPMTNSQMAPTSKHHNHRPALHRDASSTSEVKDGLMASLSQVNISGLRAATDETREKGRRVLWVFLLSVCFAVMVAQITDRVRHFLSEPVSVQVTVARNSSLTYPAITLCNKNMFNMSAVKLLREEYNLSSVDGKDDIASLLAIPGLDAASLWQKTQHHRDRVIKECWFGRNVTCDQRGKWSVSLTTMGVCHTYTLNDSLVHLAGIFHNLYLKIYEYEPHHYRGDSGWKFYLHHPLEVPILGVQTHGTSLYPGQGRDLRLDLKKIWALHHTRNTCETDLKYLQNNCFIDCFMRRVSSENITCSLPYMIGSPLPYCTSASEYRRTEKVANDLFFYGGWNPNECHCTQQCLRILFTSSLESTTDKYSGRLGNGVSRARVRIYYQNLQFEFIKEEVGYGTIDLLCDVGGTLSLLMGASLLTCCELLEVAWFTSVQMCCRKGRRVHRRMTQRKRRRKSSAAAGSAVAADGKKKRRRRNGRSRSRGCDEDDSEGEHLRLTSDLQRHQV